jgi:hypothetical protein
MRAGHGGAWPREGGSGQAAGVRDQRGGLREQDLFSARASNRAAIGEPDAMEREMKVTGDERKKPTYFGHKF